MKVIVCLDDRDGMLFHNRRQSRDRKVIENLLELVGDQTLWIQEFSKALFQNIEKNVMIEEMFLWQAKEGEYCFVESEDVVPALERVEELILYRWNRIYPSDVRFKVDLTKWRRIDEIEFAGSSHNRITRERYMRG